MAETEQNLDSLLERSSGTDVILLLKAKEDAKRRVRDDPSAANLSALSRVSQMLRDAMATNENGKNFPDIKSVLDYLLASGRKIAQSTLYRDFRRGLLRRQPDKSFRQRDVDAYAKMLPVVSLPEAKTDQSNDLAREQMQENIEKIREQKLSIRFSREKDAGKYILREEVALELASRATILALGLRSVFRMNASDYIRLVGGNIEKAEELATEFEKNIDTALHEYSKPIEFGVEFMAQTNANEEDISGED